MKKLWVLCGNAGAGKTTAGRKLAKDEGAALLDIDTVSEKLVMAGLRALGHDPTDRDSPRYKEIYREAIHETLFGIAEENLPSVPCVVVAPFTKERRTASFHALLTERFGSNVEVIYVTCDDEERRKRIESRSNPRDAGKLVNWEDYAKSGEDVGPPPFPHSVLKTDA